MPVFPAFHLFPPAACRPAPPTEDRFSLDRLPMPERRLLNDRHFLPRAQSIAAPLADRRKRSVAARNNLPVLSARSLPGSEFVGDIEWTPLQVDVRVDLFKMDIGWNLLVLHRQQHLHQAGHPRRRLQMADVGLDRTQTAMGSFGRPFIMPFIQFSKCLTERLGFDGVP